jgi:hypothetical protein
MNLASAGTVALLAVLTSGCVGLQLGANTSFPTGPAREITTDDGYFQIRAQAKITNRENIVTCDTGIARWFERVQASTILVSVNDVVGAPVMTIGVDDAKELCDRGTEMVLRFRPMQQIPGTNAPTKLRVIAANDTLANIKVGQIVKDITTTVAFAGGVVGAGPTSGLLAVAATGEQISPNLPEAVTRRLRSGVGLSREVTVDSLAANERIIIPITTDHNQPKPFGQITIDTIFMPSLFSDKAVSRGTTNFRGVRPEAILETVLVEQDNKRVRVHLREAKPSLDGLAGEARASGNNDTAKAKFAEVCRLLNDYAYEANFTTRDTAILKWAYLRRMPQFGTPRFWPEDCFNEDDRQLLRSMNFAPLPG